MSNLTSTVPGAFNAFYALLAETGAAQENPVPVFHTQLGQFEPPIYVLLKGVEAHRFTPAQLGAYTHDESYDIVGEVSLIQGDVDPQTVLVNTWTVYQAIVMSTYVANRGSTGPVLGPEAPADLQWMLPSAASYSGEPGSFGSGGAAGFAGTVEFVFSLQARIRV